MLPPIGFCGVQGITGLQSRNIPQVEMSLNMHGLLKFPDIRGSIEEIFKFETPKNLSSCHCKGTIKCHACRSTNQDSSAIGKSQKLPLEIPACLISLLSRPFGLGWRDKNKADVKATLEEQSPKTVENLQGKPTEEHTNIKVTGDEQNA
ncbi:hypothetical protein L1987_79988 [Smallanthus sonchifolius]|uniref:Uncharacterized protein n=1 Tax=Smallanthus sonchifolius TaxID=185202 RepID=A0ACB8YLW0_9ASTR|nr:hypothetical protein L1987_79988 [Smallanthus sonchifolius]